MEAADLDARFVGTSPAIIRLKQQIKRLAGARTPVLLHGESGTGKDIVAEILHASSAEEGAQLVRIACGLSSEANFVRGLMGANWVGDEWGVGRMGGPSEGRDFAVAAAGVFAV
ncbi:MAG: sigma 54-interacting transcriptional regulator [Candidatus Synoicihabitans palmerolidicus]|nr:sigma 54-interacting transcriptional regulator [Candidatus Synoicihabitans palmerolidicus]